MTVFLIKNVETVTGRGPKLLTAAAKLLQTVVDMLHNDTEATIQWFTDNVMLANPDKFQAMFLGNPNTDITLNICEVHAYVYTQTVGTHTFLPSRATLTYQGI